jgi:hypothetical protein
MLYTKKTRLIQRCMSTVDPFGMKRFFKFHSIFLRKCSYSPYRLSIDSQRNEKNEIELHEGNP